MGLVSSISKEEQGECIEKIFREMQGKFSSRCARRHRMARHSVDITLEVYRWYMDWGKMFLGCSGWVAEHAHMICAPFPLCFCPERENR